MESRPHKGLQPGSKIKWPNTHEFRKVTEKGSNFKIKTEGMEENSDFGPGDSKAFDEMLATDGPLVVGCNKRKAAPSQRSDHQIALGSLRSMHRQWEDHLMSIKVVMLKAASSEYVAPKYIEAMNTEKDAAIQIDNDLNKMDSDVRANAKKVFDADEINEINEKVAELKKAIESTKKLIKKVNQNMEE